MTWAPWTDKKGRVDPLRAVVFTLLFTPGLWLAWRLGAGQMGARPLQAAIHSTGYWAVSFLVASLMVRPAKALLGLPNLITVRRMVGNAGLAYALLHLLLYVADQNWRLPTVVTEIALRFYLTIGFVALVGLLVLGATSTDGAIRRMGTRWKALHRLTYGIALLALFHFVLQTKADVSLPLLYVGVFVWLMAWRYMPLGPDRRPLVLGGLTAFAALATLAVEWTWYRFGTHIDPAKVLRAELDTSFGLHPVGQVVVLGLFLLVALWAYRRSQGRAGENPAVWVVLFALGAPLTELLVFVFGIDRLLDPGDTSYLWLDAAWAALMGVLGFVRWRCGDSIKRHAVDALGVACVLFQLLLADAGGLGAGIVLAAAIGLLWAAIAWQTWDRTKAAAIGLVPLGLMLAYGVSNLM